MSPETSLTQMTAVAFESRKADTTLNLLQRYGIKTISAPSMQEVPLQNHSAVFTFGEHLLAGRIDILICMTGVGTDMMIKTLKTKYSWSDLYPALSGITVVSRGPKPAKVLRKLKVPIDIKVPEPNTWKEILEVFTQQWGEDLSGRYIAIQEYGEPNETLNEKLRKRGAEIEQVSIYRWALPDDLEPLKKGILTILEGKADVVLFTSKTQADHVMKMVDSMASGDEFRKAMENVTVASIGPVCTDGLEGHGIGVDFEPSRPKLGVFIRELAQFLSEL